MCTGKRYGGFVTGTGSYGLVGVISSRARPGRLTAGPHRRYGNATREQAELLQVAPNSLLLRVQSISYAQNRAIVDFSEIYQNTSKYNVKHITRR